MATKQSVRGRVVGVPFKAGVSGNPAGRPKMPEDLKIAKKLSQARLEVMMNRLLQLTPKELTAEIHSGSLTCNEMLIAQIISKGITGGDQHRMGLLLSRLFGNVKEKVEHSGMSLFTIEKKFGPDAGAKVMLGAKSISEDDEQELEEDEHNEHYTS